MKKTLVFGLALAMGMLVGCGDDSSSNPSNPADSGSVDPGKSSASSGTEVTEFLAAFFPTGYKAEDVVAWYTSNVDTILEKDQTKLLLDAVYLFKDGSFLATESKLKIKSDVTKLSTGIATTGTWTGAKNDFENGSFEISFVFKSEDGRTEDMKLPIDIKNGKFTLSPMGDTELTFTLMSSKVPTPSEPSEKTIDTKTTDPNSSSSGSTSSENVSYSIDDVEPFFPTTYKAEDVAAWYATGFHMDEENDRTKYYVDAVYLFNDGTFLATECQLKERPDRITFEKKIAMTGTWSGPTDGFVNGTFEIEFEGMTMSFEVEDGYFIINPDGDRVMSYSLQNIKVPAASDPVDVEVKTDATSSDNGGYVDDDEDTDDGYDEVEDLSCEVKVEGNSVIMTSSIAGFTSSTIWTLDGDNIVVSYDSSYNSGEDDDNVITYPSEGASLEMLKREAEESCKEFESGDYIED